MRWVDKYKSTNNITRKKRDYTSYKITNSNGKQIYSVDMMIAYVNIFKPKSQSIEVKTLLITGVSNVQMCKIVFC